MAAISIRRPVELKIMNDGTESGISSESDSPREVRNVGMDREESPLTENHEGEDKIDGQRKGNNRNNFQIRRNISMQMLDVALLMANVSQLRTTLDSESAKHYTVVLSLLVASIACHIISAILLYILFVIEKVSEYSKSLRENVDEEVQCCSVQRQISICAFCSRNQTLCYCWKMYKIDCVATFFVFVVTVLNVFITAFIASK